MFYCCPSRGPLHCLPPSMTSFSVPVRAKVNCADLQPGPAAEMWTGYLSLQVPGERPLVERGGGSPCLRSPVSTSLCFGFEWSWDCMCQGAQLGPTCPGWTSHTWREKAGNCCAQLGLQDNLVSPKDATVCCDDKNGRAGGPESWMGDRMFPRAEFEELSWSAQGLQVISLNVFWC